MTAAYGVLIDEAKRREYDLFQSAEQDRGRTRTLDIALRTVRALRTSGRYLPRPVYQPLL